MSKELKSCPFCGGEAEIIECPDSLDDITLESGRFVASCKNCVASIPAFYVPKERAIKSWNTRHQDPDLITQDPDVETAYLLGVEKERDRIKTEYYLIKKSAVQKGLLTACEYYTPERVLSKHKLGQIMLKTAALVAAQMKEG